MKGKKQVEPYIVNNNIDEPIKALPEVKQKKTYLFKENHAKYTSYKPTAELRTLGNLNDTFNADVSNLRQNFERKRKTMDDSGQKTEETLVHNSKT